MKTLSVILLGFMLGVSCKDKAKEEEASRQANLEKEKQAIKAVIENETKSFFARDFNAWKSNYAQTDYAFQAWSNDDGTFDSNVG